jgi:hypothetical protein
MMVTGALWFQAREGERVINVHKTAASQYRQV